MVNKICHKESIFYYSKSEAYLNASDLISRRFLFALKTYLCIEF